MIFSMGLGRDRQYDKMYGRVDGVKRYGEKVETGTEASRVGAVCNIK